MVHIYSRFVLLLLKLKNLHKISCYVTELFVVLWLPSAGRLSSWVFNKMSVCLSVCPSRRLSPAETEGHAVRPEDEIPLDAEDGDEQQHHQAEALQSSGYVLRERGSSCDTDCCSWMMAAGKRGELKTNHKAEKRRKCFPELISLVRKTNIK